MSMDLAIFLPDHEREPGIQIADTTAQLAAALVSTSFVGRVPRPSGRG